VPLNDRKIINIILNECKSLEERCDGYREEIRETIVEIITAERQHRVQGTNIQQKINGTCQAVGDFLASNQDLTKVTKENT